jgi:hypothetical protein
LVWANTSSHVYHRGGENYGKTKHAKFMTEADARQQGYKAAKESADAKPVPHKPVPHKNINPDWTILQTPTALLLRSNSSEVFKVHPA